ncbi:ABC transporter substrate-binding protein [Aeromicrobium duanguangcaii]|uniref:ABC transporter substrate-binding protein n=1 Tax=Aeromicrobium duanguangcaii TaxID=2968086 RepID=A0ABY5KG92_9ACTN|nr:ABC transporter substrate-binding protein [Aeromicrobium duanguangcaii]MCD9153908.1 ABC transporter substrate-binding protein [Aeromicrobium duanguangcaii]UUI69013.1 ABC transporter substrate-binding protein [Aeromicrobium duanguangcaii]
MTAPRIRSLRRGVGAVGVLLLSTSVLAACGGSSEGGDRVAGKAPESLVMDLRNDVDTFDPFLTAADQGAVQMYEALYDTPVRRDLKTGEYVPAMATDWDVTTTKISMTFRDGLKCSDGSDLTATDIANSMKRLADPKTGSIYTGRLFGAGGVKQVVADDAANTVSIEVNEPHSDLLDSMSTAFVICPKGLADTEALATQPQGSGPYKVTSLKRGDTYVLEAWDSPALEDPDSVPGKITFRVITNDATRANLFETGDTDIAGILGRDSQRLEGKHEPIRGKAFEADSLTFNQRPEAPMSDERLRRVVAQAIDAGAYTKAASFGVGEPAATVVTPNMDCYTESNGKLGLKFDEDRAKADLAAAGYGPGGKKLTLRLLGYDVQNSGPDYVADALRKIGIEVKVTNGTQAQAGAIVYGDEGDWDIIVFPFLSAAPHPYPLVTKMSSNLGEGGSYNFGRTRNADFDRYAALATSSLGDERCEHWAKAEGALLEQTNLVPLLWPIANYFADGLTFEATYRAIDLRTIRAVE